MNNKNFLKIKKVNEERYFKNYPELFYFIVRKTLNYNNDDKFYEHCKKYPSFLNEILKPMDVKNNESAVISVGNFICMLTNGCFKRKSGVYKYNLLSVQKRGNLCHKDLRIIFNY
jgi:hypothetical protein